MPEDLLQLIFFLIIVAVVGLSKLVKKLQTPPSRPAVPRPQTKPQRPPEGDIWRADPEEIRKFLEQLSGAPQPSPEPPPVTVQRPPARRPTTVKQKPPRPSPPHATYREQIKSEEAEELGVTEARELLQPPKATTHVELAREIEESVRSIQRAIHQPSLAVRETPESGAKKPERLTSSALVEILRRRDSIRQAFMVSEILGPPRGLGTASGSADRLFAFWP